MAKIKRLLLAALTAVFGAILLSSGLAGAQNNNQNGGSGLSISPTRTELRIEPGKSDKVEINVKNITSGDIIAKPFINDFESDGVTGEPKLYSDANRRSAATIANFVKGLQDIPLTKGQSKDLVYAVEVPANAAPGGYYGAITFRAVPAASNGPGPGEVALTANVSSLVLMEVPGNITEQIQVRSIKAYLNDNTQSIFASKPNFIGVEIKNSGNGFSKPFGRVVVKDMFCKEIQSYEINNSTPRSNILPNSSRIFKDNLKGISKPGRYTMLADISHGSGGEVLSIKGSFWYLPSWFLILLGVIIGLIVLAAVVLWRRHVSRPKTSRRR